MKRNKISNTIDEVLLNEINTNIQSEFIDPNDVSDGYHTFGQLYDCRLAYNAALFNEWAKDYTDAISPYKNIPIAQLHPEIKQMLKTITPKYKVHKAKKHYDGELCFGGGWFIVVAVLPTGQITNHYKLEDWDKFMIPETEKALVEFDGHTTDDVIDRLLALK